jgi:hypothetical protein
MKRKKNVTVAAAANASAIPTAAKKKPKSAANKVN